MRCQHCGKNDATFYYRSNVNGRVTEQHLCADCAAAMGLNRAMPAMSLFDDDFFTRPFRMFEPLLGGLGTRLLTEFPEPVEAEARAAVTEPERTEPGLVDGAEQERLQRQRQRNALEAQMKTAIETENFEEAARLRDELKKLA